jgi:mannose/fructose/N-acetylgalactosamine-specific phosphotransferase system component IIB
MPGFFVSVECSISVSARSGVDHPQVFFLFQNTQDLCKIMAAFQDHATGADNTVSTLAA